MATDRSDVANEQEAAQVDALMDSMHRQLVEDVAAAPINVATVQELIWPLRLQLAWVALLAEEDEEC